MVVSALHIVKDCIPVLAPAHHRLLLLGVCGRRRQEGRGAEFPSRGVVVHHGHGLPRDCREGGGRGQAGHRRRGGRGAGQAEGQHAVGLEAHGRPVRDFVNLLDPGLDGAQLRLQAQQVVNSVHFTGGGRGRERDRGAHVGEAGHSGPGNLGSCCILE